MQYFIARNDTFLLVFEQENPCFHSARGPTERSSCITGFSPAPGGRGLPWPNQLEGQWSRDTKYGCPLMSLGQLAWEVSLRKGGNFFFLFFGKSFLLWSDF